MKFYLLVLSFAVLPGAGQAQTVSDSVFTRRNIVKSGPLFVFRSISLFYERAVSERVSWVGGLGYGWEFYRYDNNSTPVPSPGNYHFERITVERRHYFGNRSRAPLNTFWGVYSRFARLTMDNYAFDDKGQFVRNQTGELLKEKRQIYVLTPGGMVGGQARLGRLTLEAFLGLQVQLPSSNRPFSPSVAEAMSSGGLGVRLGLTAGYLF
ncbi:hypothetical protein [Spirosoma fluviale]|nr:hypothetical protein [Spirosoma fluviale]